MSQFQKIPFVLSKGAYCAGSQQFPPYPLGLQLEKKPPPTRWLRCISATIQHCSPLGDSIYQCRSDILLRYSTYVFYYYVSFYTLSGTQHTWAKQWWVTGKQSPENWCNVIYTNPENLVINCVPIFGHNYCF